MYANVVFNCTIDYCFYENSQVSIWIEAGVLGIGYTGTYTGSAYLSGCNSMNFPFSAYMPCTIGEGYLEYSTQRLGAYLGSNKSKFIK